MSPRWCEWAKKVRMEKWETASIRSNRCRTTPTSPVNTKITSHFSLSSPPPPSPQLPFECMKIHFNFIESYDFLLLYILYITTSNAFLYTSFFPLLHSYLIRSVSSVKWLPAVHKPFMQQPHNTHILILYS